jgi:hypothetical protein
MGDTPPSGSDRPEGGPGWRIREPTRPPRDPFAGLEEPPAPAAPAQPPPSAATPPATPPPLPPLTPATGGGATARSRRALVYGLCALVLFGVAGGGAVVLTSGHSSPGVSTGAGTSGAPVHGRTALVAAIQRTESDSMRADLRLTDSFSGSRAGGLGTFAGGEFSVSVHIDQESANRSELRETVDAYGVKQTMIAVLYDGTVYVSTDNGAAYQTVSVDQAAGHDLSPKSPLAFLEMVGDVKETGDVEVNSVPATSYHATLDPVKLGEYVKRDLASQHDPVLDKLLNNIGITDGTMDAAVDPQGNLVSENGTVDVALDLGAFSPADAGSTMNMHEGVTGSFSDYGSAITVTVPKDVTGSMTL